MATDEFVCEIPHMVRRNLPKVLVPWVDEWVAGLLIGQAGTLEAEPGEVRRRELRSGLLVTGNTTEIRGVNRESTPLPISGSTSLVTVQRHTTTTMCNVAQCFQEQRRPDRWNN